MGSDRERSSERPFTEAEERSGTGAGGSSHRPAGETHPAQSATNPTDAVVSILAATGTGLGGFAAIVLWQSVLVSLAAGPDGELARGLQTLVGTAALGLGTASAAAVYLRVTDRDLSFVDLHRPGWRDAGYAILGVVGLFGALFGIQYLFSLVGVASAQHGITRVATENPEILLVLIPASWLVVGPGEELLFRNVVQKSLYSDLPRWGAVVVASVVFAAVHFSAYSTGTLGQVLASLSVVLALSLILGTVYARTDNLLVPAFVHGTFNGLQFAALYYSLGVSGTAGTLLAF